MNISEIAKKAQVSTATVSRVINDSNRVRPATKEKVLRVIEENGYSPSAVAKSLSIQNTHNIGVIFPDIENPFFSSALIGISKAAEANGYNVSFFNTDESADREHRVFEVVRSLRLNGVVLAVADMKDAKTRQTLRRFEEDGVAVVLLDRALDGGDFSLVSAEDRSGAYKATRQLILEGHKKIAIIRGRFNRPVIERYEGFVEAMEEAGVPIREEYVVQADQKSEIAYQMTEQLLQLPVPPTAIFTCNNKITLGCLRYLTRRHIVIGKDISLIGFDEIETLRDISYNLSVVDRSAKDMGQMAMELLLKRMEQPDSPKTTMIVPSRLILRGSEKISSF